MDDTVLVIVTALCSGLIATLVTIFWQKFSKAKMDKVAIFTVLMSKRYELAAEECVDALNMIDVVFYRSKKVREAWKNFHDATRDAETPSKAQNIQDKHLKLLEVMAEDIGYKDIRWDEIKQYYYPVALSNRKQDEAILRKAQIDVALQQIKNGQEGANNGQIDAQSANNQQLLLKALENPDGFVKLLEATEKMQSIAKQTKRR